MKIFRSALKPFRDVVYLCLLFARLCFLFFLLLFFIAVVVLLVVFVVITT